MARKLTVAEVAAKFRASEERLIYSMAWGRAALRAPAGRYDPDDLAELRALVEETERQFPNLMKKRRPS